MLAHLQQYKHANRNSEEETEAMGRRPSNYPHGFLSSKKRHLALLPILLYTAVMADPNRAWKRSNLTKCLGTMYDDIPKTMNAPLSCQPILPALERSLSRGIYTYVSSQRPKKDKAKVNLATAIKRITRSFLSQRQGMLGISN